MICRVYWFILFFLPLHFVCPQVENVGEKLWVLGPLASDVGEIEEFKTLIGTWFGCPTPLPSVVANIILIHFVDGIFPFNYRFLLGWGNGLSLTFYYGGEQTNTWHRRSQSELFLVTFGMTIIARWRGFNHNVATPFARMRRQKQSDFKLFFETPDTWGKDPI